MIPFWQHEAGYLSPRASAFCGEDPQLASFYITADTQRQFLENICSEDDLTSQTHLNLNLTSLLTSRIFGTFVVKFLACLPLLGFSNI